MASFTSEKHLSVARLGLGGLVLSFWPVGWVLAQEVPCKVDWQRGVLTISADNAPRAVCLESVAQRTGLRMSGVTNVRGSVTLTLSTPQVAEAVRKLAGDASYTFLENEPDRTGSPRTQAVSFAGAGTGVGKDFKASRAQVRDQALPVAMVENLDSGVMEAALPLQSEKLPEKYRNVRPDPKDAPAVQVRIEN